jgi:hypothetical protein
MYYDSKSKNVKMISVSSSSDFIDEWNKMQNAYKVYLFLHGGNGELNFYYETILAETLYNKMKTKKVSKCVYLFSCKGGAGKKSNKLAYVFSKRSKTYVFASPVKVSYGYCGIALNEYFARVETSYLLLNTPNSYWHKYYAYKKSNGKWKYKSTNLHVKKITTES